MPEKVLGANRIEIKTEQIDIKKVRNVSSNGALSLRNSLE